jgi:hypothetical protein
MTDIQFIEALAARFPSIQTLLQEHRDDNDGETLSHLVMADIERHAESLSERNDGPAERELREILDFLEKEYSADDNDGEVQNVIAVSFLEHLPRPGEPGSRIRKLVGPSLMKQLHLIG